DGSAGAPAPLPEGVPSGFMPVGPEGARPRRSDPFRSALVAGALLFEPLFQGLHQLVPAAQRLHQRFLFLGESAFHRLANPFFGNPGADVEDTLEPMKVRAEG